MCSNDDKQEIGVHFFGNDGFIPNNPTLPLLIYPAALDLAGPDPGGRCIERFASHGWINAWRNGIYVFPHYHSVAHEVLGICAGWAKVRLGGELGLVTVVRAGDALLLPAGTGHQNLGSSPDLLVVGAYPNGMDWDLCRGHKDERPAVLRNIEGVACPAEDPLHGQNGPLTRFWQGSSEPSSVIEPPLDGG